jgi:hypothetical protein
MNLRAQSTNMNVKNVLLFLIAANMLHLLKISKKSEYLFFHSMFGVSR